MLRKIFKYPIDIADEQFLELPQDARILSVQVQDGIICIWAMVRPDNPTIRRRILVVGTGNPLPDEIWAAHYLGTVQVGRGVWHVFEAGGQV